MSRLSLVCLSLFLMFAVPATAGGMAPVSAAELQKLLASQHLAGATWSLVDGDDVQTGAAGVRDMARGAAMRAGDRVHIGSITKTLVALGLLRLASEGRVDLDAPVSAVIPELRFRNPWQKTDPVRIRHLLDHSSGLGDARLWQMFSTRVSPDDPLIAAFTRDPSVLEIRTRPGERTSYSNMGYALAGLVIDRVTGVRYERWLDAHLLGPLGMADSSFGFVSQLGSGRDARLAWGHHDDLTPAAAMPIALRPAGQFTTTARDMAILARFLMSDGRVGGAPFVRADLLRAMGRPTGTAAARAGLGTGYALGLARRDRHGAAGLCHGGNIVGYRAMLCLYPAQRKAFFVSVNTDSERADYARIDATLAEALRLRPAMPFAPAEASMDPSPWLGRYVPAPSRFAIQSYPDLLTGGFSLTSHSDGLALTPFMGSAVGLAPAGGHLLRADGRVAPSHVLLRDADGTPMLSDGMRSFRLIGTAELTLLWLVLGLGVAGLLYFLLVAPILAWRHGRAVIGPGTGGVLGLAGAALVFQRQSFASLGDASFANLALAVATILLPLAMAWQAIAAIAARHVHWRPTLTASLAVLALCATLAVHGLMPLMLWR